MGNAVYRKFITIDSNLHSNRSDVVDGMAQTTAEPLVDVLFTNHSNLVVRRTGYGFYILPVLVIYETIYS